MGPQIKEVGGGSATGLADNYISQLQKLLNGGGTGTAGSPDAGGSTGNIMSVLSDLLSGGGGKAGGDLASLFSKQQERDINGIRARFGASGGAAYGTPGAYAETRYRAESAPQIGSAVTGLQLQAILPLLQMITGLSGKGISQRETVQTPGALGEFLKIAGTAGQAALPFLRPRIKPQGNTISNFLSSGGIDITPRMSDTTSYLPKTLLPTYGPVPTFG